MHLMYKNKTKLPVLRILQLPSSDELASWAKLVLGEASDLDTKSLLSLVTMENIQRYTDQKKKDITKMAATAAET